MRSDLRRKILNEIKDLLKEEMVNNIKNITGRPDIVTVNGNKYQVLDATACETDELRKYIEDGAKNSVVNKRICPKDGVNFLETDEPIGYRNSLTAITCRNEKPVSLEHLSTASDAEAGIRKIISRGNKNPPTPPAADVPAGEPAGTDQSATPKTDSEFDGSITPNGNIKCRDRSLIVTYQQFLKYVYQKEVKVDGIIGPETQKAAQEVYGKNTTLDDVKQTAVCKWLAKNKPTWISAIKSYRKKAPAKEETAPAVPNEGRFYDNKKLVEAKKLYERLLENL